MPVRRTPQRLTALIIAAALAFNYPLLFLAAGHGTVLGIPSLYLYLFATWALLIGAIGILVERARGVPRPRAPGDTL